jgi:hypothetical protein
MGFDKEEWWLRKVLWTIWGVKKVTISEERQHSWDEASTLALKDPIDPEIAKWLHHQGFGPNIRGYFA